MQSLQKFIFALAKNFREALKDSIRSRIEIEIEEKNQLVNIAFKFMACFLKLP